MAKNIPLILASRLVAGVILCSVSLAQAGSSQTGNKQPAPLSGLTFNHVTISVEDLDREAEWYGRVLGFKVTARSDSDPGFLSRQLRTPDYRIDMIKYKGSARPAPVQPLYLRQGWIHIAFNVPDLPAALTSLQALNTDVVVGSKDAKGVPTRLIIHDPEGNELEFFTPQ